MIECGWGPLPLCNLGLAGGRGGRGAMIRALVCAHVCVCVVCRQPTSLWVCVKRALGGWEIASLRKSALHLPPADTIAYITTLLPVTRTSPFSPSLYYPFIPPSAPSVSFSLLFWSSIFVTVFTRSICLSSSCNKRLTRISPVAHLQHQRSFTSMIPHHYPCPALFVTSTQPSNTKTLLL